MIKATLKERYISSENGIAHERIREIVHETRIFSSEWIPRTSSQRSITIFR